MRHNHGFRRCYATHMTIKMCPLVQQWHSNYRSNQISMVGFEVLFTERGIFFILYTWSKTCSQKGCNDKTTAIDLLNVLHLYFLYIVYYIQYISITLVAYQNLCGEQGRCGSRGYRKENSVSTEISLKRNEMTQARDPVVFSTESHKLWEHKRG